MAKNLSLGATGDIGATEIKGRETTHLGNEKRVVPRLFGDSVNQQRLVIASVVQPQLNGLRCRLRPQNSMGHGFGTLHHKEKREGKQHHARHDWNEKQNPSEEIGKHGLIAPVRPNARD